MKTRTHEITLRLQFTIGQAKLAFLGLILLAAPLELGSETITLSTTYPSPVGIYHRLITTGTRGSPTGDTYLNRDAGDLYLSANSNSNIGIGVPANPTGDPSLRPQARLDVRGAVRFADQTADPANICGAQATAPNGGAGLFRYNSGCPSCSPAVVPHMEFCNGTAWTPMTVPTSHISSQLYTGSLDIGRWHFCALTEVYQYSAGYRTFAYVNQTSNYGDGTFQWTIAADGTYARANCF